MKVLLVNTYPTGGGAAVACRRTLELLLRSGIEARMLTMEPFGYRHRISFVAERLDTLCAVGFRRGQLFRFSTASYGVDIAHHPWVEWADIVHLHWVQQGFLSLRGLGQLLSLRGKKILWTLHDLWPLTGGCHIPYIISANGATTFCHAYQKQCGCCPLLGGRRVEDRSYRLLAQKSRLPLHLCHPVAVSSAVGEAAHSSALFHDSPITVLHNPIALERFTPQADKKKEGIRLLFIASRIDDPVKGLDLLKDMLSRAVALSRGVAAKAHITLVGRIKEPKRLNHFPIPFTHLPSAEGDHLLQLYRSATAIISTSRYETLGQTLLESIACGTPALAFAVGGIPDIIRPETGNGILVTPYDTNEMAHALLRLMGEKHSPDAIAESVQSFGHQAIAPQLLQLYASL